MWRRTLGFALVVGIVGCGTDEARDTPAGDPITTDPATGSQTQSADAATSARAVLRDRDGNEVGTATLTEAGQGVRIEYTLSGMEVREHGFHLHEVGSCQGPTFESAGAHYNPTNRAHGLENPDGPHAGDLPNISAGAGGGAGGTSGSVSNEHVTLRAGQPNSVLDGDGTALVIHANPDDNRSQPSGNSGDRIACGVIERA